MMIVQLHKKNYTLKLYIIEIYVNIVSL